jgi:hypothetical protein
MGSKLVTTNQLSACIMRGLFFDPEDENSGKLVPDYMASYSRRQY